MENLKQSSKCKVLTPLFTKESKTTRRESASHSHRKAETYKSAKRLEAAGQAHGVTEMMDRMHEERQKRADERGKAKIWGFLKKKPAVTPQVETPSTDKINKAMGINAFAGKVMDAAIDGRETPKKDSPNYKKREAEINLRTVMSGKESQKEQKKLQKAGDYNGLAVHLSKIRSSNARKEA